MPIVSAIPAILGRVMVAERTEGAKQVNEVGGKSELAMTPDILY
jgi:hypothetical protein